MTYSPKNLETNKHDTLATGFNSECTQITDGASPSINLTTSGYFRWTLGSARTFPDVTVTKVSEYSFFINGAFSLAFHTNYIISPYGDSSYNVNANYAIVSLEILNIAGTLKKLITIRNITE